jgi:hypothetical protein
VIEPDDPREATGVIEIEPAALDEETGEDIEDDVQDKKDTGEVAEEELAPRTLLYTKN